MYWSMLGVGLGGLEGTLLSYFCQFLNCWGIIFSVTLPASLQALTPLFGRQNNLFEWSIREQKLCTCSSIFVSFSLGSTQSVGSSLFLGETQCFPVLPMTCKYGSLQNLILGSLLVHRYILQYKLFSNKGGILLSQLYVISQWVQNMGRDEGCSLSSFSNSEGPDKIEC